MVLRMRAFVLSVYLLIGTITFTLSCPLDSIGMTKQEGKFYLKYLVEPGETIYRISTKYGIPVSDLLEENPDLEKGLKVGQIILIPYLPEKKPLLATEDVTDQIHTVEKGETYFSIAKKYNIPIGDLLKLNNVELKVGQKVIVAKKGASVTNVSTAKQTETLENSGTFNASPSPASTATPEVSKKESKLIVSDKKTETTVPSPSTAPVETPTVTATADYVNVTPKIIVVPFDPYLYFSDADDEIAGVSHVHRTKVRQAFRKRLNAYLEPKGYETIHLLGGAVKDSTTDLNKVYSSISYTYDNVMMSGLHIDKPVMEETKGDLKKSKKGTQMTPQGAMLHSRSALAKDEGKYFAVRVKDPGFFPFFNNKYKADYYLFVSQFEVKTNYENCLDRARQNYERTFTTHFTIFDKNGVQISGGRVKSNYESGTNNLEKILADNIPNVAERILSELPSR